MLARPYRPEDAASLDKLLDSNRHGDVRLARDRIIVAGPVGDARSCLIWRPTGFLHEFHVGSGLAGRAAASALTNYAAGDVAGHPHAISDVVFLVDSSNAAMLRFVRELHAQEQPGRIFTLPLRPEKK